MFRARESAPFQLNLTPTGSEKIRHKGLLLNIVYGYHVTETIGGSRGAPGTCPRSKFFHFHAVFGKNNRLAHPLWELALPQQKFWIRHCKHNYGPPQLLWEGNVFTGVFQSFFSQVEVGDIPVPCPLQVGVVYVHFRTKFISQGARHWKGLIRENMGKVFKTDEDHCLMCEIKYFSLGWTIYCLNIWVF